MTVTSTNQKVSFSGNGSTTVFAYNFKIFAETDLLVILRSSTGTETTQNLTSNYTVSGVGATSGGNVTMGTAPASGTTLVIQRVQPQLQGLDLVPNDPFPAQSMEDALDKLVFNVQTLNEEVGRAIKASTTNTTGDTEFTISAADRANKLFSFDSSGNLSIAQELGTYRGDWSASTAYAVRDLVKDTSTNNIFICITAHTSSGSQPLTTNTDSAKWALIVDAASATASQTAAAASATLASQWAIKTDDTVDGTNYSAKYWATRADVAAVAGKATEIGRLGTSDAVADLAILGTDAIVSNLGTVAGIAANVTSVAGVASNVTTVAGISSAVSTVAADGSDIGTVAGISSAVSTVSSANANVSTVAGAVSNVNTVAGAVSNVNTVAGAVSNVNTVAGISSAVSTVAADATDIGNVSGSIANVNTVATNLSGITAFSEIYSSGSSDPSSNLNAGDLFFNTGSETLKVYDGSAWVAGVTAGSGFLPLAGGTMTGNLAYGDNVKATFGSGDLQIFHDGSNSYVSDTGTGDIIIKGDMVRLQDSAGGNLLVADANDAVKLYYGYQQKLTTTATGVDVTGNVAVSGTVDGVDLQTLNSAVTANTAKTTNATHSGEVTGSGALTIADNVVDEANLKVSNSPVNGYFLSAQSGNAGGLTWAEAGGGYRTLISTTTIDDDATVLITGLSSTYSEYQFVITDLLFNDSDGYPLRMRVQANSAIDSTSGNYRFSVVTGNSGSSSVSNGYSGTNHDHIDLGGVGVDSASPDTSYIVFNIINPSGTTNNVRGYGRHVAMYNGVLYQGPMAFSYIPVTYAVTGLQFYNQGSSGTLKSGTIKLYGIS